MAKSAILEKTPPPQMRQRPFHGRRLPVWEGVVKYDKVQGWVDNPRIRLICKRLKEKVGDRDLAQDEVFDIMKNDKDIKLDFLRDDILQNGLREPIVLSSNGQLLDGNRRFFAIRFLLENLPKGHPDRQDYEKIHAYVLDDSCSRQDEDLVLVEENFHASLKIEWPDYVKAMFIKEDWTKGLSHPEIAKKYGWNSRKVGETIRIIELIDDFLTYATDSPDPEDEFGGGLGMNENQAEAVAAENYQYFNEAQKSFLNPLKSDPEFKVHFFKWIADGKFSSFPEVRVAYEAWRDAEARSIIASDEPTAAKDAKAVIDYKRRVLKGKNEVKVRIEEFTRYLESLSVAEINGMTAQTLEKLHEAMNIVDDMAASVNKSQSTNEGNGDKQKKNSSKAKSKAIRK